MVHLLSTCSQAYQPLAELTFNQNKLKYAEKHGYRAYNLIHTNPYDTMWGRPKFWLDTLSGVLSPNEWLFITGADLIITQPAYKMEQYIDDNYEFICTVDRHQVFGDCLLMKSTPNTIRLLQEMLDRREEFANEQMAFSSMLSQSSHFDFYCDKVGAHIGTKDFYQKSEDILNSSYVKVKVLSPLTPKKICGDLSWIHEQGVIPESGAWYQDTFSLHMGGKPLHFRLGLMPYLLKEIQFDNV